MPLHPPEPPDSVAHRLPERLPCPHCAWRCDWYCSPDRLFAICPQHGLVRVLQYEQTVHQRAWNVVSDAAQGIVTMSQGLAVAFGTAFFVYAILGCTMYWRDLLPPALHP